MPRGRKGIEAIVIALVVLFCLSTQTFETRSATPAATPTFSLASGTYTSMQSVMLSSATSGATICYTLDGTTPTADGAGHCANGLVYGNAAIIVAQNDTVLQAIATKSGYADSSVASATYDVIGIQGPVTHGVTDYAAASATTISAPLLSHTEGDLLAVFVVGSTAPSAVTDSQGNTYTAVEAATNHGYYGRWFYAFAQATGSNLVTATFATSAVNRTIQVLEYANIQTANPLDAHVNGGGTPSPVFSTDTERELVLAGWMTNQKGRWVAGADYTLTPDSVYFNDTVVVRPVEQRITSSLLSNTTATITQNAPANVNGVWVATFRGAVSTGEAATPTFSPAAGTYTVGQDVSLSSTLSSSVICYTVDGTTPAVNAEGNGCTAGSLYTSTIPAYASQTIKAIAGNGTTTSPVVNAAYLINAASVISFTHTGATFQPMIVVEGNPTILWTFDAGGDETTTQNVAAPTSVTFADAATRTTTLSVSPWSAVKTIDVGYSIGAGAGGTYNIPLLAGQNVTAVSGLSNVAPYLRLWASDNNAISSLDFTDFTALEQIENESNSALSSIILTNTPQLKRLVVEENDNLSVLDLSQSPRLADLRNRDNSPVVNHTITWGATGKYLWHLCAGARNMLSRFPLEQFPNLEILYIGATDQTGILDINSTKMTGSLLAADNNYSEAYLSGAYPAGNNGTVDLGGNNLSVLEVADNPGLISLNASNNKLSQAAVDNVLRQLDEAGLSGGTVNLSGNLGAPSSVGQDYITSLQGKGWTVTVNATAAASPVFYPAAGDYFAAQTVTLSSVTSGSVICYTTDGTTPAVNGTYDGCTTGTLYAGVINVTGDRTFKAVAAKSGYASSPVVRAAYRITGPVTHVENYQTAASATIVAPSAIHTAGNLLAVFLAGFDNVGTLSVTDSQGNTYVPVGSAYATSGVGSISGQWFYAYAGSTGENTVTGNFSNGGVGTAGRYRTIRVMEYANVVPASPVDFSSAVPGAVSSVYTTSTANEIVLASFHIEGGNTACYASDGFTLLPNANNCVGLTRPVIQKTTSAIQTGGTAALGHSGGGVAYTWLVSFKLNSGSTAEAPTFSVAEGSYDAIQNVGLSTATSGATICYTTDGSTPATDGAGACAGGSTKTFSSANPIRVSSTTTIKAVATKSGSTDSPMNSARYIINGIQGPITHANTRRISAGALTVAATETHTEGNLLAAFVVTTTDTTISVADSYTTFTPVGTLAANNGYFGQWFYAFAAATGSNTVTATFGASASNRSIRVLEYSNIDTGSPVDASVIGVRGVSDPFTTTAANELILAGWHVQSGVLSSCTAGSGYTMLADDYCSLEIGRPVEQRLTSSIQTNAFAAMGRTDNTSNSNTGWVVSFRGANTPTFSVPAGSYGATQSVALASSLSGSTLCYTLDGSDPITDGAGHCLGTTKTYGGALSVSRSQNVRVVATKSGAADTAVASAIYNILTPAATPTFSVPAGAYAAGQSVILSTATSGASICYTTDGSTPASDGAGNCTTGSTYSGAIAVDASLTLKAIAAKGGYGDSAVASAAYHITGAYGPITNVSIPRQTTGDTNTITAPAATHTQGNLLAVFVVTNGNPGTTTVSDSQLNVYTSVAAATAFSGHSLYGQWFWTIATASGSNTVVATTTNLVHDHNIRVLEYANVRSVVPVDTYSTWGGATSGAFSTTYANDVILAGFHAQWSGEDNLTACAAGAGYTLLANDYCSTNLGRPVIQMITSSAQTGITASIINTGGVVYGGSLVALKGDDPVAFSSAGGNYNTVQNVALTSTIADAVICYTTDGTNPAAATPGTCSAGAAYADPIVVNASQTIKALATKAGYGVSPIESETYVMDNAPAVSLPAGKYAQAQSVTLSTITPGATICYTTNGVDPAAVTPGTCSSGTGVASGTSIDIPAEAVTTLKALTTKAGIANSAISSAVYEIQSGYAINFTTTGASFHPLITVTGSPVIQWTFGDGQTSGEASPTITFATAATRTNTLVVNPWSAVTSINVGYGAEDGGSDQITLLPDQHVSAVTGLSNVAASLVTWASSYSDATALDFSNFSVLETMECYRCELATINLDNASALKRLDLESNELISLDLSDLVLLEDLRATGNNFTSTGYITWPADGMPYLWHLCAHSNTFGGHPVADLSKFPAITQLWIRDDQQAGTLAPNSIELESVWAQNNQYTAADFSGNFPLGNDATLDIFNNGVLASLDITNDPGLDYLYAYDNALTSLDLTGTTELLVLDLHNNDITSLDVSAATQLYLLDLKDNQLTQAGADQILHDLDTYGERGAGLVDLSGSSNAAPSLAGQLHAQSLREKGWVVLTGGNVLSIGKAGNGGTGSVDIDVNGSDFSACGAACSVFPVAGSGSDTVTLTATADAGSTFAGWSGACTGTGVCTTTLDAAKTVTAHLTTEASGIHGPVTHAENIIRRGDYAGWTAPQVTHTKGNLIAVFVGAHELVGSISVSDTMGNTYASVPSAIVGGDITGQWFYAIAKTTGLNAVSTSFTEASYVTIRVLEYAGVDALDPFDVSVSGAGGTSPAFTTTSSDELILAAWHTGALSCTAGTGYTLLPNDFCGSGITRPVEHRIVSSIQTNATAGMTGSSSMTGSWVATFRQTEAATMDATLSALGVSASALSPSFASGTKVYTVDVASNVASLAVTPTAAQGASATITVNGETVISGSSYTLNGLVAGSDNQIVIVVTAPDLVTTETYTLTVHRAAYSTFYVDDVNGNDSYDGTEEAHTVGTTGPWKTIGKVNAVTFQPGDQILFKKGGVWRGSIEATASGTGTRPIVYGSYGTGASPVINPSLVIAPAGWTLSGSIYSIDSTSSVFGHLTLVYEDGVPLQKATDSTLADGYWYLDSGAYILYYKTTDAQPVATHTVAYINENYYGAVWDTVGIDVTGRNYITIDGLDFEDANTGVAAQQPGFDCASCSLTLPGDDGYPADFTFTVAAGLNITDGQLVTAINVRDSLGYSVETNQVSVTGTATYAGTTLTLHVASAAQKTGAAGTVVTDGRWRFALDSTGTEHITVRNCIFDHNFGAISAFNAFGYGKVGNNNYWLVENNTVSRGATGFEWGSQWYAAAPAGHLTIRNNELSDMGTIDGAIAWSTLMGDTDQENIGMQNASDSTVEGNYIHGGAAEGIYWYVDPYGVSSDNATTRNFVFDNGARGYVLQASNYSATTATDSHVASYNIFAGSGTTGGSTVFFTQGLGTTDQSYFVHNTLYAGQGMYEMYFYDRDSLVPEPMFNIAIENNLIVSEAAGIYLSEDSPTGTLTIDHNLYHLLGTNKWGKDDWMSWVQWQAAGFDAHSLEGVDPQFVNAGGAYALATDYRLQATSPAINRGAVLAELGLTADYEGNAIVSNPDMGALETSVSGDATLSNLTLSSGSLTPGFAAGTTAYAVSVANSVASLTLTPTVNEAHATVTVNTVAVASGSASDPISLNVGENVITVAVTAQDASVATYTVTVTRAEVSGDATLSNLTLSSGSLTPGFAAGTTAYSVSVANSVASLTVTPTVNEAHASVTVDGTSVVSGSASGAIALSVGANSVQIVVTAEDATTTQTYALTVTRAAASSGSGGGGTIKPTAKAPVFTPAGGSYASAQSVALSSATSGVNIYYTLDGTTPSAASNLYTAPILVDKSLTVKAIAMRTGYATSPIASAQYVISSTPATPTDPTVPTDPTTPAGTLIKTPDSNKVYVLIDGKKKWIPTPEVFEQLGYAWTNISVLTQTQLDAISDYEDNLIRQQGDCKVYLVVNGVRRHIPNPEIFLDYGFRWEEVKDVDGSVLDRYREAYLIRESGQASVFFLAGGVRKHIPTAEIFASYEDRWEDVQIVSRREMESYPVSNLIRLGSQPEVYVVNNAIKLRIPDAGVFAKYHFAWGQVISVNQAEFDYYRSEGDLK